MKLNRDLDYYYSLDEVKHNYTLEILQIRDKDDKTQFIAKVLAVDDERVKVKGRVLLSVYEVDNDYSIYLKSIVSINTALKIPNSRSNPKCFDYNKYLKSIDVYMIGTIKNINIISSKGGIISRYERKLYSLKRGFISSLPVDSKGIISGILFGDTTYIDDEIYDDFRKNGTSHILAVSGLHVGVLYTLYKKLIKRKYKNRNLLILGFLLFSFASLSNFSVSTIRACLMIAISIFAKKKDLYYDPLTSLSVIGLALIIRNPYVILGTSFQMSFLAIISISLISPVLPKKIPEIFRTTIAINIGLFFYQTYNFNYISFSSLLANAPIIYLTSYFVPLALLYFILFSFGIDNSLLSHLLDLMSKLIVKINSLSTVNGLGSIKVVSLPLIASILGTLITFFLFSEYFFLLKSRLQKKRIIQIIALSLAISITFSLGYYSPISSANLVFIDVGQGDAIHIHDGSTSVLIDGGGNTSYNIGKNTLKPYFLHNRVKDIDLSLLTHMHTDHYLALSELVEEYQVKQIVKGSVAGDMFRLSSNIYIKTIWPLSYDENDKKKDENENCSVFIIFYNGYKIMVTGDLDEKGESGIINTYSKEFLDVDVLKVGHHGSKYSTSNAFLDIVKPEYAVIQVGTNTYGHPNPETLKRLEEHNAIVLRNDELGAIGFNFNKSGIKYYTMK